ncbi:ATP-binding protein [Massilia atriviolacea]|uniref:ATP-binding protein n=1 Tax=Massilia atriviolacea TaxID=2495579 RepID=A0A430HCK3_9BURK|nr:ATP-binding protein [Massilia atriviolacea]RSZ55240.1 ATP-binding protein [Massilia atriviolacea]
MEHFARPILAKTLADGLQGRAAFGDASSGLFLSAPRRTGKSTFLQLDLTPELESRGAVVVYCDLWSDTKRNPAHLIADSIANELSKHLGIVARTAKSMGLEEVNLAGWMKIDTTRIGKIDGITLTDAVKALHEVAKKPIALIIDEAQHSLTSTLGESAMTALKSARDQMNRPGRFNLMLVMSGSDRDKLLRLVNSNGAPFYGSSVQQLPNLGLEFVSRAAALIEQQLPARHPINVDKLLIAFNTLSCRPQFFASALGDVLNPLNPSPESCEDRLVAAALKRLADDEAHMKSDFLALRPLEQSVLWRLLDQGSHFRPYDADALNFYAEKTDERVTAQQVQHVLEVLRTRTPSMVWKSARGDYAIQEAMMYEWFAKLNQAGAWPPVGPERPLPRSTPLSRLRDRARRSQVG